MDNTAILDRIFIETGLVAKWEARGEARGETKGRAEVARTALAQGFHLI